MNVELATERVAVNLNLPRRRIVRAERGRYSWRWIFSCGHDALLPVSLVLTLGEVGDEANCCTCAEFHDVRFSR